MSNKEPSPCQIRAAMAILRWEYRDLSRLSGVSVDTLSRICLEKHEATARIRDKIRIAFEINDIQFLPDDGVKRSFGAVDRIKGDDALHRFFDDVYETIKEGGQICVSGVNENIFRKFNIDEERGKQHRARMAALKDKITFRALIKDGDYNFKNNAYIEYRWFPSEFFFEHPIYLYNNKLAFIKFENESLEILRISMPSVAAAFRSQFDFIWSQSIIPPKQFEVS